MANEEVVEASLTAAETAQWLYDCHPAYRTRPHELLIAALTDTLAHHSDESVVRIDLEGHGREDLFEDVDLSRTIGWFTTLYPCALKHPGADLPRQLILSVKEQLRSIPHGGLNYGLLRWLSNDAETRSALETAPRREISFNYLGQFDNLFGGDAPFALAAESAGPNRSPRGIRPHVWEIIAYVRGGCLRINWHYATTLHERSMMEQLAGDLLSAIRRLIAHCLEPGAGGVSPIDFPLSDLDQQDLDQLADLLDRSDESATEAREG